MCFDFFVLFFSGPVCGSKMAKSCESLFKIITCIVLGCQPASTILGEARGPFVATYVVLKLMLLYRRMVLQLHTVCGGRKLFISFSFCFVCIFYDGISNAQFDTSCCSTILFDMHAVEEVYKKERTKVSGAK